MKKNQATKTTANYGYFNLYRCALCGTKSHSMNGVCPKCGAKKTALTVADVTFDATSYR